MTTYEYVARRFNEDPLSSGFAYGTVTAPDCLDTLDGDASYVEYEGPGSTPPEEVTFRLEPAGAPAPPQSQWTSITAALAWKRVAGAPTGWSTVVHFTPASGATDIAVFDQWGEPDPPQPSSVTTDDYLLQWATVDLSQWPDALGPDTVYTISDTASTVPGRTFRVTYFRVFIAAGAVPTRVYPRADGLGMGAPRLMDNRSPYRSARVFGQI